MNRACLPLFLAAFVLSGCAVRPFSRSEAAPKASAALPSAAAGTLLSPKAPDLAAQKLLYEEGLKQYSDEKYVDAKKAWEQALAIDSSNELAKNILEYVKKTDQVLKTLQEIEIKNGKPGDGAAAPPKN